MIKYIITWVVLSMEMASCPDSGPYYSDLGIPNKSMISCAAMHWKTVKTENEKTFTDRDSAFIFIDRLKKYKPVGFSFGKSEIENIKIDSLKIK